MTRIISVLLFILLSNCAYSQHKELFKAIVAANYDQVVGLIDKGTAVNGVYQRETALTIATLTGNRKMAALLIDKGATISAQNYQALQYAIQFGMADVIGLYVSHMRNANWQTFLPYHGVVEEFPIQAARWILEDYMPGGTSPDPEALPYLRISNDSKRAIAAVDTLLKYQVPADLVDEEGQTALDLCFAMDYPRLPMLLHLMERKFPSRAGVGPSQLAYAGILAKNDSFVISVLQKSPQVINATIKGHPLLHTTLLSGNDRLADTLLAMGANPALTTPAGRNAAHLAAIGNCTRFFEKHHTLLLPLMMQKDTSGLNGLETAVVYGNDAFKEMLLGHYLDTAGVSSKVFPLIATLSQEHEKISFTDGTFRFIAQMIQRNNFRYSNDAADLEPLYNYVKQTKPSPATMQYFIHLLTHVRDTALTTATFQGWYGYLNSQQKTVLLRSAIDRTATLFFLAKQPDAVTLWPVVAEWKPDLNQPGAYMERLTITAAHAKNWDFLRLLIQNGARVNDPGATYSLLFACAAQGALEMAQFLLAQDARLAPNEIDILFESADYLGERPVVLQYILTMELLRKQMLTINPADDLPLNKPLTKRRSDLVKYEQYRNLKPVNVRMLLRQLPAKLAMGFPDEMKPDAEVSFGILGKMSLTFKELDYLRAYNEKTTSRYFSLSTYIPDFGYRPFIDLGSLSPADLQKAKLRTDTKLDFELPFIPYDSLYPVTFPIATISNDNYNTLSPLIKIIHGKDTGIVISGAEKDTFDLSTDKVIARMPFVADKSALINIGINMHEGYSIDTPRSNQFIDRLKYYQQIDAINKQLIKSSLGEGNGYSHTFEHKKFQTVLHVMSEYAAQQNFLYKIQQELKEELAGISNYNTQLKSVYNALNQVLVNPGDKSQLLQLLDKLLSEVSSAELKQKLQVLREQVKGSADSIAIIDLVATFLKEGVFGPVNYSVVHVQTLLFELSQMLTKKHLEELFNNQLKIPENSKIWNANNVVFKENDIDGKGGVIIKNLVGKK
ncbi:hypothetical protein SAMN05444266_109232 [Chitinophaga jiangningensis]|uniref:Ankyrin repeat-containing protein n=1 Tax=Chitinophaga jiangningensis TaxID=1419482 RepID=A0A1M7KAY1_9BACT|nr:ankyrin repeat domain-containing protein [Chitinophaga jiangningensis]SHM62430.1 hypothetical protein SAMN05444266_109232 [Chitinophaga jiangningensis]